MHDRQDNQYWEALADDCEVRMGDDGNPFHRELIRPATLRLLEPQPGERVLDAACGNGLFSLCLAKLGCEVRGFDFSPKMIAHAKRRCAGHAAQVKFSVADATDYDKMMALGGGRPFDKAVANMAVMDIEDIRPLFRAVHAMLAPGGVFVFSAVHPCFQTPGRGFTEDGGLVTYHYIEPQKHAVRILANNDKQAWHWHRPLQELLGTGFAAGFVLDGLEEPCAPGVSSNAVWEKLPLPIVIRMRKT